MQIVLSAHFDIAKPIPFIELKNGRLHGLVDNFAGVFVAYQAARNTNTPLYLTNFEETGMHGARAVSKNLLRSKEQTKPLIIVVDTTRDAEKKPAYVGNAYRVDTAPLRKFFSKNIRFMPGLFEATEDETWVYGHEFGFPTLYFGIPIPHEKSYHTTDNTITQQVIDRAAKILTRLIGLLQQNV